MIKTTFICDRCGAEHLFPGEANSPEAVPVDITLTVKRGKTGYANTKTAQRCNKCAVEVGVRVPYDSEQAKLPPAPDLTPTEPLVEALRAMGMVHLDDIPQN